MMESSSERNTDPSQSSIYEIPKFSDDIQYEPEPEVPWPLLDALRKEITKYSSINNESDQRSNESIPPVPDSRRPERLNVIESENAVVPSSSTCISCHNNKQYRCWIIFGVLLLFGILIVTAAALIIFGDIFNFQPDAPDQETNMTSNSSTTSTKVTTATSGDGSTVTSTQYSVETSGTTAPDNPCEHLLHPNCTSWSNSGLSVKLIDNYQLNGTLSNFSQKAHLSLNVLNKNELLYRGPETPLRCKPFGQSRSSCLMNSVNFTGTSLSMANGELTERHSCACLNSFDSNERETECEMIGFQQDAQSDSVIGYCTVYNNDTQSRDTYYHFPAGWTIPWKVVARNVSSPPYIWQYDSGYYWVQESCSVEFIPEGKDALPQKKPLDCGIYLAIFSEQSREARTIGVQEDHLEDAIGINNRSFVILTFQPGTHRKKVIFCSITILGGKKHVIYSNDVTIIEDSYESIAIGKIPDQNSAVSAFYYGGGLMFRNYYFQVLILKKQLSYFYSDGMKIKGMGFAGDRLYTLWCSDKCQLLVFSFSFNEN